MKKTLRIIVFSFILLLMLNLTVLAQAPTRQTSNTISGFVYDAVNRTPITDIYVELMNDVYSVVRRVRTDGTGKFFFGGIGSGNFKVRVLPVGTNFLEDTQDAQIINSRLGNTVTSDNVYLDFYLRIDKRKVTLLSGVTEAVFVQEIPEEAKKFYGQAITSIEKDKNVDQGIESLKRAVEIFPNYYDANLKLGVKYVELNKYYESMPYLIKAISINQRSFLGFYWLGVAAYNLQQYTESSEAFRAATVLNPQSLLANIQYGTVLRISNNLKLAEEVLLKVVSLTKETPIPEPHFQLALLYGKLEKFEDALKHFETCYKLETDSTKKEKLKPMIEKVKAKVKSMKS